MIQRKGERIPPCGHPFKILIVLDVPCKSRVVDLDLIMAMIQVLTLFEGPLNGFECHVVKSPLNINKLP